jgi:hypothetical protein
LTILESPKLALGLGFLLIPYIFVDSIGFWRQVPLVEKSDYSLIFSHTPMSLPHKTEKLSPATDDYSKAIAHSTTLTFAIIPE